MSVVQFFSLNFRGSSFFIPLEDGCLGTIQITLKCYSHIFNIFDSHMIRLGNLVNHVKYIVPNIKIDLDEHYQPVLLLASIMNIAK